MFCTQIVLNVRTKTKKQFVYTTCSVFEIFMYWPRNSMNNLLSFYGLVDVRISTSNKNLCVQTQQMIWITVIFSKVWIIRHSSRIDRNNFVDQKMVIYLFFFFIQRWGPFNDCVDKMTGEGVNKWLFLSTLRIYNCPPSLLTYHVRRFLPCIWCPIIFGSFWTP